MVNHELLKPALSGLAKLQIALREKGGAEHDGELFEEVLTIQDAILKKFELPPTPNFENLLWFATLPTELELYERERQLYLAAKDFLSVPAKSEMQILEEAEENKQDVFSVLPLLGISTHSYTNFVYDKILLTKKDSVENVLSELKTVNQSKILSALGHLEQDNINNPQEAIQMFKDRGLKYIDDFVKTFPKRELQKTGSEYLDLFWSDINGEVEYKTLEERFKVLAYYLMNHLSLVVGESSFRIVECEFYYYDHDNHPDPYVHRRTQQLFAGNWYFNDSGLDLTFGDYDKKIYASILIRGLHNLITNQYISGTSNVLRAIFDNLGNALSSKRGLCFRQLTDGKVEECTPILTARIGLERNKEDMQNFIDKPYRFIIGLNPPHKFRDKEKVVKQLLSEKQISIEEAKNILGYNIKL